VDIPGEAQEIDASDKTVIPGLIDSHTDFLAMGYRLSQLGLSNSTSILEIVDDLERYIQSRDIPIGRWVQGRGWDDQNLIERRYPTRYDLDKVSPDHPVALTRICGHMIILNSKALESCNITKNTPNPPGGIVDKDEQGEPTGVLRDARSLVTPYVSPPTHQEHRQGIRDAIKYAIPI